MSPRRTTTQKPKRKEIDTFSTTLASLVQWAEEQGIPLEHVGFAMEFTYYDQQDWYAEEMSAWRKKKG